MSDKNNKKKTKKRVTLSTATRGQFVGMSALLAVLVFALTFVITLLVADKLDIKLPSEDISDSVQAGAQENSEGDAAQPGTTASGGQGDENTTASAAATTSATTAPATTAAAADDDGNIPYPTDTAQWKMICVNRNRRVPASSEEQIDLAYVAGSSEMMDSRAAAAYEEMYDAAAADGIYLTPCSGYRSYSTQKRLFNEFYYEYINQGYSESEAYDLTCRRRNPAGSSEHNLGICMDIICAATSANFQNTQAYAWLDANAYKYGFILRYPEDKTEITGVKFEPWHWRYVGTENAKAIKDSGLCLEEYLGLA